MWRLWQSAQRVLSLCILENTHICMVVCQCWITMSSDLYRGRSEVSSIFNNVYVNAYGWCLFIGICQDSQCKQDMWLVFKSINNLNILRIYSEDARRVLPWLVDHFTVNGVGECMNKRWLYDPVIPWISVINFVVHNTLFLGDFLCQNQHFLPWIFC